MLPLEVRRLGRSVWEVTGGDTQQSYPPARRRRLRIGPGALRALGLLRAVPGRGQTSRPRPHL